MAPSLNQQLTFYLIENFEEEPPSLGEQTRTGIEVSMDMLAMLLKFGCFIIVFNVTGCKSYILSKDDEIILKVSWHKSDLMITILTNV